jgi:hypothetical protein
MPWQSSTICARFFKRTTQLPCRRIWSAAVSTPLLSFVAPLALSFELTKPTMAYVERMLGGDSKKTSQPLSMSEVGALLDAPHVTTSAELSAVVQLREREN